MSSTPFGGAIWWMLAR